MTAAGKARHCLAELARDLVLGCPEAGLTHGRFARSRVEAGEACRSLVSFEGSFWLFRWHFLGAGQRRAAIAGWDHEPCGVSRGVGASRSRATDGRESAAVLVAHSWTKLVGLPTISGQDATGFLRCDARDLLCGPAARAAPRAAPRRAALLDCVGAVAPGGVKRDVAIAPVIRPALH